MTLKQDLQAYHQHQKDTVPAAILEILSRNTSMLQQQNLKEKALIVGEHFPEFTLQDSDGEQCSLKDLLSQGPVVVSFYRGGWCPYCVIELKALRDIVAKLPAVNATLVAISPEAPVHCAATKADNNLNFRVLSDFDNALAHQCGLVFPLSKELIAQYINFGIDICERHKNDHFELPIPATYIVGIDRKIHYAFVEEDYISRAEPTAIIEVLARM